MNIADVIKKYKHYITIVSAMGAMGTGLFVKIDAYAQSKVDAGVESLRIETTGQLNKLKVDIQVVKIKQDQQQKQLDRIEDKQDDMIHLLIDMKKTPKDGK